jgi:hypothetical protein
MALGRLKTNTVLRNSQTEQHCPQALLAPQQNRISRPLLSLISLSQPRICAEVTKPSESTHAGRLMQTVRATPLDPPTAQRTLSSNIVAQPLKQTVRATPLDPLIIMHAVSSHDAPTAVPQSDGTK